MRDILILLLFTILWQLQGDTASASTASFKGGDYLEYKITDAPTETKKDKVTLKFKTTEAYGVLIYSCGEQGDFLLLELKRGKIVYTGNFGSLDGHSGSHQIILGKQYNDNQWHAVTLLRENGTHVYLTIDRDTKALNTPLDFVQLNLDTYLYVGGYSKTRRDDSSCPKTSSKKYFIGCLSDVRFNSIDLLYGAKESFTGFKTYGKLAFACPSSAYNIFGLHKQASVLTVRRNILIQNELDFAVEMRTFEPEGHIATHKCVEGDISLDLIAGKVRLEISFLGLGSSNAVRIVSPVLINDGDWHSLQVVINRNHSIIIFTIDETIKKYQFGKHFKLSKELGPFMSDIRFGGNTPLLPGLITCIRKLKTHSKLITFDSKQIVEKRAIENSCQIKDLCFPNPCQHGSTCTQKNEQLTCNCTSTGYKDATCGTCIHKATCRELKESGETASGFYKICPNNERIFVAYCDMKTGATVIKHHTGNDTMVNQGQLIESSRLSIYYHSIQYTRSMAEIRDLLHVSVRCQQYIRYDCYQSRLLFDVGRYRNVHFKGARWFSRRSEVQHYWGGATAESMKCGCGMDNSCAKDALGHVKDCNCDVGDKKWRYDAGFLTDKETLPVTQIQFSKGPETNVKSHFTIGNLKCFGTIPKSTKKPILIPTVEKTLRPSFIDSSMFHNVSVSVTETVNQTELGKPKFNQTLLVKPKVQPESLDSLFSKPWLITIVVVGALLCLLLVFLVFLLFRQQINDVIMKCFYGNHITKPRIEIEDYNRYSTATEDHSDWDIYRWSTTFPTSTPEPSYGPTDDESVHMRVRTLEDLRGKRRFKRLTGWGSRTASAPTVVGGSKRSISDNYENFTYQKETNGASSDVYHTSDEIKPGSDILTCESSDTERAYSTTATDGEADSVIDTNSEFSHPSQDSSMKESACTSSPKMSGNNKCNKLNYSSASDTERPKKLCLNTDNYTAVNGIKIPAHVNGPAVYADPVKAYIPVVPINGYRQGVIHRAHPVEFGTHVQMLNNNGRCALPNGSVTRLVPINRRTSNNSDSFQLYSHPTIQERPEEASDEEDEVSIENVRNSDGFYELYEHEHGSPSSETRLLFDDASSREECEREADEQIKLLKKKVIEKATSADECQP